MASFVAWNKIQRPFPDMPVFQRPYSALEVTIVASVSAFGAAEIGTRAIAGCPGM